METEDRPLTPEARAIGEPAGVPVVLGDGDTWIIARFGLAKDLAPIRDEVYQTIMVRDSVEEANVLAALWLGLATNYDLDDGEIRTLIGASKPESIIAGVVEAVLPLRSPDRTFTAWARAALLANGLRVSDIPEADLPNVLDMIVARGGAPPHAEWTDAGVASAKRSVWLKLAAQPKPAGAKHPTE